MLPISEKERQAVQSNHQNYGHLCIHVKHMHKHKGSVYCARKMPGFEESIFHNPIYLKDKNDPEERIVCAVMHRRHMYLKIASDSVYRTELAKLAGLVLVCWCSPLICHCSSLAAAAVYLKSLEESNAT